MVEHFFLFFYVPSIISIFILRILEKFIKVGLRSGDRGFFFFLLVEFVTKFPDQECAISCATKETRDLSPAIMVAVANVNLGFSMPPNGKLGGKTMTSYLPQAYGPYSSYQRHNPWDS